MGVVLGLLHQGPIGSSRIDHLLLRLLPASLRRGLDCQHQAFRQGGHRSAQADLLLTIGDELETRHGWTPLRVDLWLDRLGLWDQEL